MCVMWYQDPLPHDSPVSTNLSTDLVPLCLIPCRERADLLLAPCVWGRLAVSSDFIPAGSARPQGAASSLSGLLAHFVHSGKFSCACGHLYLSVGTCLFPGPCPPHSTAGSQGVRESAWTFSPGKWCPQACKTPLPRVGVSRGPTLNSNAGRLAGTSQRVGGAVAKLRNSGRSLAEPGVCEGELWVLTWRERRGRSVHSDSRVSGLLWPWTDGRGSTGPRWGLGPCRPVRSREEFAALAGGGSREWVCGLRWVVGGL